MGQTLWICEHYCFVYTERAQPRNLNYNWMKSAVFITPQNFWITSIRDYGEYRMKINISYTQGTLWEKESSLHYGVTIPSLATIIAFTTIVSATTKDNSSADYLFCFLSESISTTSQHKLGRWIAYCFVVLYIKWIKKWLSRCDMVEFITNACYFVYQLLYFRDLL